MREPGGFIQARMEEDGGSRQFPAVGSTSPFMSFEDIYKVPKRPASNFEEFWERKRSTSSYGESTRSESKPRIYFTGASPVASAKSFMNGVERKRLSLSTRLSNLGKLPRIASFRQSELSERTSMNSNVSAGDPFTVRVSRKIARSFGRPSHGHESDE